MGTTGAVQQPQPAQAQSPRSPLLWLSQLQPHAHAHSHRNSEPRSPLLWLSQLQPKDHNDALKWEQYRCAWQTAYQECLLYWQDHDIVAWSQAEVDYWTSLHDAQEAYKQATGLPASTPWRSLPTAFYAYEEAIEKRKQGKLDRPGIDVWLEYFHAWLTYRHAWCIHWGELGQPWRFEPEIDLERQKELGRYLAIVPDVEKGTYPFKNVKLTRADVEWLLATHKHGKERWSNILASWNPVRLGRPLRGLDLRGADLSHQDLHRLPLAELRGGLAGEEWRNSTDKQRQAAVLQLEGANLYRTCFRAASLRGANLKDADLEYAYLEQAALRGACLQGANLRFASLDRETELDALDSEALDGICVADIHWGNANLAEGTWPKMLGDECKARSKKTIERSQRLQAYKAAVRANRQLALALRAQGVNGKSNHFAYRAQVLERKVLGLGWLSQWENSGPPKAGALEGERRRVRTWQRVKNFGCHLLSWIFFLVGGYGYKFWRIVLAYFGVVIGFALVYQFLIHPTLLNDIHIQLPGFWSPLIRSLVAFHGRPLLVASQEKLYLPWDLVPMLEALIGLMLESILIAMLVQRFSGKSGD